jgi:hypothetical protein
MSCSRKNPMNLQPVTRFTTTLMLVFMLAACNAPTTARPTSTPILMSGSTDTPPAGSTVAPTAPGAPTQTTIGGCTNAYFPVASGASWSYDSTGSDAGDFSITRTLSGVSDTGFTQNDDIAGTSGTILWSCNNGNLTSLTSGSSGTVVSRGSTILTIDSVNATGYVIPGAFTDGTTWSESLSVTGTSVDPSDGKKSSMVSDSTTNCTTAGTESVKVPAGTFDTLKITCLSNQVATVTLDSGASTEPVTTIVNSTQWYALGIGLVQKVNAGDAAGVETIQLTAYSLP